MLKNFFNFIKELQIKRNPAKLRKIPSILEVYCNSEQITAVCDTGDNKEHYTILYQAIPNLPNIKEETIELLRQKTLMDQTPTKEKFDFQCFWYTETTHPYERVYPLYKAHLVKRLSYEPDPGDDNDHITFHDSFCKNRDNLTLSRVDPGLRASAGTLNDVRKNKIPLCEKCLEEANFYTGILDEIAKREWNIEKDKPWRDYIRLK